jgi:hypothetical protein
MMTGANAADFCSVEPQRSTEDFALPFNAVTILSGQS